MILIIDGMNMAHRARHAYKLSYQGMDTSVTYGLMRMLMALMKKFKPESVIFCWDGGTPGYRTRLLEGYKASRKVAKAKDDDWPMFLAQVNELEGVIPLTGILQVRRRGIEADDLMAQAAKMVLQESVIVTTDDDLLQCVDDNTSVWSPIKEIMYTKANFEELIGYPAFQHVAAKVLGGDKSDNVQGVRGMGPASVRKFLSGDDSKIAKPTKVRLEQFINDGKYNVSYTVMDLGLDFAGSRYVLANAEWQSYSKELYRWCISKGFTSLIEAGTFGVLFGQLKKPVFADMMPYPRIWDYKRYPPVDRVLTEYDGEEL